MRRTQQFTGLPYEGLTSRPVSIVGDAPHHQVKVCGGCGKRKHTSHFYKNKRSGDGLQTWCKCCCNKYAHSSGGRAKVRAASRAHSASAKGRVTKKRHRDKYRLVPHYLAGHRLRARLHGVLRRGIGNAVSLVGSTRTELRAHLEAQFTPGMSWDNYGRGGWEVDHIVPVSAFDLSQEAQRRECFHYTNLQPLWAFDNQCKGPR